MFRILSVRSLFSLYSIHSSSLTLRLIETILEFWEIQLNLCETNVINQTIEWLKMKIFVLFIIIRKFFLYFEFETEISLNRCLLLENYRNEFNLEMPLVCIQLIKIWKHSIIDSIFLCFLFSSKKRSVLSAVKKSSVKESAKMWRK